jgi:hypothetical protein
MKPYDLTHRTGEKAEGIIVTKIGFCRERELRNVIQRLYVLRSQPFLLHFVTVVGYMKVNPFYGLPKSFSLHDTQFITIHAFKMPVPDIHYKGIGKTENKCVGTKSYTDRLP